MLTAQSPRSKTHGKRTAALSFSHACRANVRPLCVYVRTYTHSLCDSVSLRRGPVAWQAPAPLGTDLGDRVSHPGGGQLWILKTRRARSRILAPPALPPGGNSSAPPFIQAPRDIGEAQTHPGYPAPSYTGKWARWRWGWAWAPGLCPPEREAQQPAVSCTRGPGRTLPEPWVTCL